MTPQEVGDLLRFASSVDPWLKQTSPEEGAVMVAGWGMLLEAMPADVAMQTAREHYAQGDAPSITPGHLLDAWAVRRRREQQETTDVVYRAQVQQELAGPDPAPLFGSGAQYLAAMMTVVAQGGDPTTVVRPAGVRVRTLSPEAEARERQCRFPDICACTHLECRDGWLDEPGTRVDQQGRSHEAVVRCPQCEDGLQMAQERGLTKRPRKGIAR